jgi:hypothetical protein
MVNKLVNGECPEDLLLWFKGGRFCALKKTDGSPRMVTIGMAYRRLAAACQFAMMKDKVKKLFGMEQLAIAIPNGAEMAPRTVRMLMKSMDAWEEEWELFDADVKDAFHAPPRGVVWQILQEQFPEWLRFYELSWHGVTMLRAQGHVIKMRAGYFMGMPDASVMFALCRTR